MWFFHIFLTPQRWAMAYDVCWQNATQKDESEFLYRNSGNS